MKKKTIFSKEGYHVGPFYDKQNIFHEDYFGSTAYCMSVTTFNFICAYGNVRNKMVNKIDVFIVYVLIIIICIVYV